jgi:RNA polymerase sigma-70 factor (ECF subfamily)
MVQPTPPALSTNARQLDSYSVMEDPTPVARIEALYRADAARFYRVALALVRDRELAWDVVQEGFADAVRGSAGFRGDAPLDAWVWRLVTNAALRTYRRREPTSAVEPAAVGGDAGSDHVVDELARLPERQRLVVFLRFYADLDYRTIAEAIGVEVGTVSATLHAALTTLRRRMEVSP